MGKLISTDIQRNVILNDIQMMHTQAAKQFKNQKSATQTLCFAANNLTTRATTILRPLNTLTCASWHRQLQIERIQLR